MSKQQPIIITMVCNKGGVGRSTTTINIAWKLAELGMKTLVVDLDAQCNTSMTLAVDYIIDVAKSNKSLTNCIADERGTFWAYKTDTRHSNLDLLGATILLDETEENMKSQPIPTHILQSKLDTETLNYYDFILFDTPPSKHSKLLHNALVISDYYWYIIGSEDIWALDARRIMDMVVDSIRRLNDKLSPLPVLLTKYRSNVIQCQVMRTTCEEEFSNLAGVFKNAIRFTTQIGRSEAKRQSIYEYGRSEKVATDYTDITKELLSFCIGDKKTDALFDSKKTLKKRN
jgi:chromosome partitioning protein|tara:strand:- start:282 stop:1142 length:861 start_codon:yes stop_codon:yes gene_type:complete